MYLTDENMLLSTLEAPMWRGAMSPPARSGDPAGDLSMHEGVGLFLGEQSIRRTIPAPSFLARLTSKPEWGRGGGGALRKGLRKPVPSRPQHHIPSLVSEVRSLIVENCALFFQECVLGTRSQASVCESVDEVRPQPTALPGP